MEKFETLVDAIQFWVIDPIEASGDIADARATFDVDAIADAVIVYDDGWDEARRAHLADLAGFKLAVPGVGEFWDVVEAHALEVDA